MYELFHEGRACLRQPAPFRPDAILLDIGMPVMDGYAACRALRWDDAFKTTPIIAQTAG
jgi:CheY-like chemotaxis protein